jgi:hypothetical protein
MSALPPLPDCNVPPVGASDFEAMLTRMVGGQVRSFMHDHPAVLDNKLARGIVKRVVRELASADGSGRLRAHLVEASNCDARGDDGVEELPAPCESGRGTASCDRTRPAYFSWLRKRAA